MAKKETINKVVLDMEAWRQVVAVTRFASKDDVDPVLGAVHLTTSEGVVRGMATDRYAVGRISVGGQAITGVIDALVLVSFIKRVDMTVRASGLYRRALFGAGSIVITVVDETVTAEVLDNSGDTVTHRGRTVAGIFPDVGRIFPDEDDIAPLAAGIALSPSQLARLDEWPGFREIPWVFVSAPRGGAKVPPILARLAVRSGIPVEVLIQPSFGEAFRADVIAKANVTLLPATGEVAA